VLITFFCPVLGSNHVGYLTGAANTFVFCDFKLSLKLSFFFLGLELTLLKLDLFAGSLSVMLPVETLIMGGIASDPLYPSVGLMQERVGFLLGSGAGFFG